MTTHAAVFLSKGAGALADADAERAEERLVDALRSSGYDPGVRLEGGEIENAARRAAAEGADVVIVCGDLTQRARAKQFAAARDFLCAPCPAQP